MYSRLDYLLFAAGSILCLYHFYLSYSSSLLSFSLSFSLSQKNSQFFYVYKLSEKKGRRSIWGSGKYGATVPTRTWTEILSSSFWCSSAWATGTGGRQGPSHYLTTPSRPLLHSISLIAKPIRLSPLPPDNDIAIGHIIRTKLRFKLKNRRKIGSKKKGSAAFAEAEKKSPLSFPLS